MKFAAFALLAGVSAEQFVLNIPQEAWALASDQDANGGNVSFS